MFQLAGGKLAPSSTPRRFQQVKNAPAHRNAIEFCSFLGPNVHIIRKFFMYWTLECDSRKKSNLSKLMWIKTLIYVFLIS
ncbi:hypothetical protein MTP99_012058 [Tenebrio molitor]|nr:hypothetical protein MTP99_012058 [Tenebrio molitor]CAH1370472.1 unnamed protein product [Tenebrio molitor]